MKNMKFGFFGALALAGSLFLASCNDPCKDVTCVNGECVEGDCVCDAGYEGTDCGTAINAKFSGNYALTETCNPSGAAGPYNVTVAPKTGTTDEVTFTGLWEEAQAIVTGQVNSDGLGFTIERQALNGNFDITASTGTINTEGTTITISYTIYPTGSSTAADACSGTMTK